MPSGFSFRLGARSLVGKSDQSLRITLVFQQRKVALRKPTRKKWYALTQQNRNDAEVEPIDQICLEKDTSHLAATHQPDIFTATLAKARDETDRRFIDEDDAVTLARGSGF